MTYPALVYPDHLEIALVHSGSGLATKSKQLVDLNGSYRQTHLDMKGMGSHSKVNDMGLMNLIGNTRSLVLEASYSENEDDFAAESDPRLDITMLRAFGADIAQVQGFAQQMMAVGAGGNLSEEQIEQLQALIENVADLVKLGNLQVAAEAYPQIKARMEELMEEIAEQLNEIMEMSGGDMVLDADGLPVSMDMDGFAGQLALMELVAETLDILKQTADVHGLNVPSLEVVAQTLAEKIENMAELQAAQIEAVKAEMAEQLNAILESESLSDETRAEVEAALETLEGLEQDEAIPSELIEKLDALVQSGDIPAIQAVALSNVIETAQKIENQTAQFASSVAAITPTLNAEALNAKIETALPAITAIVPQVFDGPSQQAAVSPVSLKVETSGATSNDNISAGVRAAPVIGGATGTGSASFSATTATPTPSQSTPQEPTTPVASGGTETGVEVKSPETNSQEGPDRTDTAPEGNTPTATAPDEGKPDVVVPPSSDAPEKPEAPATNVEAKEGGEGTESGSENDKNGPDADGCGADCKCGDQFELAAVDQTADGKIRIVNPDGTVELLSKEEGYKRIEQEVTAKYEIDAKKWDEIVTEFGGDAIEARKHIEAEQKIEDEAIKKIEAEHAQDVTDDTVLDDAIAKRLAQMASAKSGGGLGGGERNTSKKAFEHVCNEGCTHGYQAKSILSKAQNGKPVERKFQGHTKQRGPQ
ncbi:MAG: hypothetical protein CMH32_00785 [Micavibrio sp.]|nr:hypothetical protein [Micavibrio sp.]HCK33325.1 hypothetical protein [Rhodospirillaceae bacterium]